MNLKEVYNLYATKSSLDVLLAVNLNKKLCFIVNPNNFESFLFVLKWIKSCLIDDCTV